MFARIHSVGVLGLDTYLVGVEVTALSGLPKFDLVGLPTAAVNESRERVRAVIRNCGRQIPNAHIMVNLKPANRRKEGTSYDLPVLVALLVASGQLPPNQDHAAFFGELSLDGALCPVEGVLPMVMQARDSGLREVYVPAANAQESAVVRGITVYPVTDVQQLLAHLCGDRALAPASYVEPPSSSTHSVDFSEVKGQLEARRALEVAAAGNHNVLLIGSPGSGKSMLAKRLSTILPAMTEEESLETTKIHSVAGQLKATPTLIRERPFRMPHHTISSAGLVGGGSVPRPGELSLAHNGVLFLDEFPEFRKDSLEMLRAPLEEHKVVIARAAGTVSYPCSIMLVCAMNPCPCGFFGHPTRHCNCQKGAAKRYLSRISGPLLDRLDLHIEVPPVEFSQLSSEAPSEPSAVIRARVNRARALQHKRFEGSGVFSNGQMSPALTQTFCRLRPDTTRVMESAFASFGLSARAHDKILRVARTLADLEDSPHIEVPHLAEAIHFRSLDRKFWSDHP